jgi:TonB family protein
MLNTNSGGGSVGAGTGGALGSRFGWYVSLLEQKVRETWDTSQIDPTLQTAPIVIVVFDLQKDGSVRNVRFLEASGHPTLDNSARRAIIDASPFTPLPDGFERNSARVEFSFKLER